MAGFDNDVIYGTNIDLSNSLAGTGGNATLLTDGQMLIASTALNAGGTHVNVGTLTSPDSSITVGYSSPNITIQGTAATTTQPGSLTLATNAETIAGTVTTKAVTPDDLKAKLGTQTNHGVMISQGTSSAIVSTAVGTAGQILQSGGASADPAYSTSTYPATNAINTLLYASAANTMSALPTANGGVLTTSATGVPSIDTTNFRVSTTGVQMKGNNTNTAPPAGFIGEQIRNYQGAGVLANAVTSNVISISLTPGVWDVSLNLGCVFSANTGTYVIGAISTTSLGLGTQNDNRATITLASGTLTECTVTVPSYRLTLSATTTVYATGNAGFSSGTCAVSARISATRVG